MKKYGSAAAFGALVGAMLIFPQDAAEAAFRGLSLFSGSVLPMLGPFMICMLMLSSRIPGGAWVRAAMGWLCGSPGGARLMQSFSFRGKGALRYAAATGTMSPMFFLGTLGKWLGSAQMGRILLISHVLGALGMALCFRGWAGRKESLLQPMPFFQALQNSAQALLLIALCMMLGCVAAKMAACVFPGLPLWCTALLQCTLEVTAGVQSLLLLDVPHTPAFVCAACSFGGLSLLLQNTAFWQEGGVSMGELCLIRCGHALLSFLICLLLGG